MVQYIDKAAVVAEIERKIRELSTIDKASYEVGLFDAYKIVLSFLNTLEVKEMDLDREIRRYRMNNPIIGHKEESLYDYMANVAKHFFGLGLNAQKRA